MRILYGVVGEGMGHATRSKVVCEHLVERGHEVKIVVSGRAHALPREDVPRRRRDRGPDDPLRRQPDGPRRHARAQRARRARHARRERQRVLRQGRHVQARRRHQRLRLVRVPLRQAPRPAGHLDRQPADHQPLQARQVRQAGGQGRLPDDQGVRARQAARRATTTSSRRSSTRPSASKYANDTTLVPPILRKPIIDAKKRARAGRPRARLPDVDERHEAPRRARARARARSSSSTACARTPGAATAPSRSSARTASSTTSRRRAPSSPTAGLSLIGEALYLGKPIFSVPVRNQYEQMLNARYLEQLGYGLGRRAIEADLLRLFLREAPKYAARVAKHKQDGNRELVRRGRPAARALRPEARSAPKSASD